MIREEELVHRGHRASPNCVTADILSEEREESGPEHHLYTFFLWPTLMTKIINFPSSMSIIT